MNLKDKVIIITGASSGIGKEVAFQLAKKKSHVVLAARNKAALDKIASSLTASGTQALAVQTDVAKKDQVQSLVKQTLERFGRLDVFISNAGVSLAQGTLMDNKEDDVRATLEINLMGAIYAVWAAVPEMEKTGGGQLVFVSSIVGKRGIPRNAVYCASKFALNGLAESIRLELNKKNIQVITVCPPGVDTDFFKNNNKGDMRRYYLHPVQKIAASLIRACEKEKREVLQTWDSKILHYGNVFFPRLTDWAVAKAKEEK